MEKPDIVRHGEVILVPVDTVPNEAELMEESNKYIVAHSETGHHHVLETLDMSKIKVFMHDGDRYLEVPGIANLWHDKTGSNIHKTHDIKPSVYKITIKEEYDYFSNLLRKVRD